jgi:MoxR-like ATPase
MTVSIEQDPREAGRVVGSVLAASGEPSRALIEIANRGLARLGRPALIERDFVISTPEEIAPVIPAELRVGLAELLLELSAEEPIRRRLALAYIGLWGVAPSLDRDLAVDERSPKPNADVVRPSAPAERVARWLVGALPRHQDTSLPEGSTVTQSHVYRTNENAHVAPPVRDPLRARVERARSEVLEVLAAVEQVIIGKRDVIARVLTAMAARGHVLLMDAPGVGKTQLCKAIAAAVGVKFGRVQFTPDLLPMDVTGANVYEAHEKRFVFRPGPVFANLLLADEINRATPKTQSALLEVMEERTVTVDGTTHRLGDPFQVLATMNPLDNEGTFVLPAAQLDRFMVLLELGHPSAEDEVRVLDAHLGPKPPLASVPTVITGEQFIGWQQTAEHIHVAPEVKRAAVDLVNALRRDAASASAVSPRATLSWVRLAQARAMFAGREYVTVQDLLDVAPEVMRHRLWISAAEVRDRLRAAAPAFARGS